MHVSNHSLGVMLYLYMSSKLPLLWPDGSFCPSLGNLYKEHTFLTHLQSFGITFHTYPTKPCIQMIDIQKAYEINGHLDPAHFCFCCKSDST